MVYKNIEIVVARYNEDLKWILEPPFNQFKYIVYNKGVNDDFEKTNVIKVVSLENVGRCDHTYLYHIVHNFNSLATVTVFFPGSLNNEYKKKNAIRILKNIKRERTGIFLGTRTNNLKKEFQNFTLDKWVCTDLSNASLNNESKLLPAVIRPYGRWFQYHFGDIKVRYWCIYGVFSMHKLDIIKHNIERYRELMLAVGRHSNPEVGHYIERSWAAIFHPLLLTKVIYNKVFE
jgi:hypothetical protein